MSKEFSVTILGCSSAIPTKDRFPTSQIVSCYGRNYLLDCGEGTQIQLRKYKKSYQRIDRIFISHMHADHFLGLPGLLASMDLLGRKSDLHIHAFEELKIFITGFLQATHTTFSFMLYIHTIPKKEHLILFENDHITIETFPVKHSITCNGFLIKEKPKNNKMNKEAIEKYKLTIESILKIKNGDNLVLDNGNIIKNEELTLPAVPTKSYAFVTDTAFYEKIIPFIEGVDVLYHESTFAEDMKERAKKTMHSTAKQAATIAQMANVKKLILGHYSIRYANTDIFLKEAITIFTNTVCSIEGMEFEV